MEMIMMLLVLLGLDCTTAEKESTSSCGIVPYIKNGKAEIDPENNITAILSCNQGYVPTKPNITCVDSKGWEKAVCEKLSSGSEIRLYKSIFVSLAICLVFVACLVYLAFLVRRKMRKDDGVPLVDAERLEDDGVRLEYMELYEKQSNSSIYFIS